MIITTNTATSIISTIDCSIKERITSPMPLPLILV